MLKNLLLLLTFAFYGSAAIAQPSPFIPDSTWGQYGIAKPSTNSSTIWIHQFQGSVLQPDGKLILAGTGNFQNTLELVRFDTTGALDTSFNHTGFNNVAANGTYPWIFNNIRVTTTGDIVVAFSSSNPGNMRLSTMCFKPDGTLKTTYGISGKADVGTSVAGIIISMTAMDMQADGKVVLAGGGPGGSLPYRYVLTRLKTNGTIDSTFGTNGLVFCPYLTAGTRSVPIYGLKVQADGKIVCAAEMPGTTGSSDTIALIRYKTNGTLDSAFGTDGLVQYPHKFRTGAVQINAAGEIYLLGTNFTDTFLIKKFDATGNIITSFGTAGTVTVGTTFGSAFIDTGNIFQYYGRFVLQSDGRMIVAGSSDASDTSDYRVCRLMPDGALDTVFAPGGVMTIKHNKPDYCTNVLVQPNGKILLTGYSRAGLATFDSCSGFVMRFCDTTKPLPPTTGIQNGATSLSGIVYPNPSGNGTFKWQYNNPGAATSTAYIITNCAGVVVQQGHFTANTGSGHVTLALGSEQPDGLYILRLSTPNTVVTAKLLKMRQE